MFEFAPFTKLAGNAEVGVTRQCISNDGTKATEDPATTTPRPKSTKRPHVNVDYIGLEPLLLVSAIHSHNSF